MATASHTDENKDAKCSICAEDNKDEIADHYCFDCDTHMCTFCLKTHNKFIKNHNVVQGPGDGKDVLTEKCGKHADELITLYCRQHDELLCRKCHLLDHRKCKDPKNISESSDELNDDPELQTVPAQLKSALDNINIAIKALDEHLASIEINGNSFLKDLEIYANKLLSRIEELKEKGKKDIKSKQDELLAVAKHHRQACALTKDEINQCLHKITKSKEWKANMFVLRKKSQTIAPKADALYNESDILIKGHQFKFLTEMKIFDSLDCFYSLVKEVSSKVQDISSQDAVGGKVEGPVQSKVKSPGDRQVGIPVEKGGNRTVVRKEKKPSVEKSPDSKQIRKINVRIPEDISTFDIYGCCHLSDGSLVVADYSNRRLKRVDPSSGKVAFGSPQVHVYCAVCLTRTRTVELGHKTSNIACHGGLLYCATGRAVVGGGGRCSNNTLYVHDVSSGRKLREISMDIGGLNKNSYITDIALNGPGDRVYVTYWSSDIGLVCINTDGQLIFHLTAVDLRLCGAFGVTTDHRGHVFVCGVGSDVVVVTKDGHQVGRILSGEDMLYCLSYDVSRSKLYVGVGSGQLLMVEFN